MTFSPKIPNSIISQIGSAALKPKSLSKSKSNGKDGLMEDVFEVMDKDGDGRLSHDDLKSYMNCPSFAATDDDIKAMIRLRGEDENDGVSSPSFSNSSSLLIATSSSKSKLGNSL